MILLGVQIKLFFQNQARIQLEQIKNIKRFQFNSFDNVEIDCAIVYASEQSDNQEPFIIYCNPNAGFYETLIMDSDWIDFYNQLGLNICLWNYRGYGQSKGTPNPKVNYSENINSKVQDYTRLQIQSLQSSTNFIIYIQLKILRIYVKMVYVLLIIQSKILKLANWESMVNHQEVWWHVTQQKTDKFNFYWPIGLLVLQVILQFRPLEKNWEVFLFFYLIGIMIVVVTFFNLIVIKLLLKIIMMKQYLISLVLEKVFKTQQFTINRIKIKVHWKVMINKVPVIQQIFQSISL